MPHPKREVLVDSRVITQMTDSGLLEGFRIYLHCSLDVGGGTRQRKLCVYDPRLNPDTHHPEFAWARQSFDVFGAMLVSEEDHLSEILESAIYYIHHPDMEDLRKRDDFKIKDEKQFVSDDPAFLRRIQRNMRPSQKQNDPVVRRALVP